MRQWSVIAILVFYITFITLLFWGQLWTRDIWADEIYTYFQVQGKSFSGLIDSIKVGVNAIPYLYFVFIWLIEQLTSLNTLSLRLPSFLVSALTVFLLHALLRKKYSDGVAFISISMGLLFLPGFARYAAEARPYAPLLFFIVLNLATSMKLKRGGWLPYITNATVSLIVPAIHYVGIFYSGILAVAFLIFEGKGGLWKSTSFGLGWLIFFVIHASHILSFLNGEALATNNWLPVPDETQFQAMLSGLVAQSGGLILLLLFLFGLNQERHDTIRLVIYESRYLILVAIGWLLIPIAFYVMPWVGLPNLAHERYYYPTSLSTVLCSAFFLQSLLNVDMRFSQYSRWTVIICLILFLTVYGKFALREYIGALVTGPVTQSPSEHVLDNIFAEYDSETSLIVAENTHSYFKLIYHYPSLTTHCHLLRESEREKESWLLFHPAINSLTPDDLLTYNHFTYIHRKRGGDGVSNFFIESWAKSNGYTVKKLKFKLKTLSRKRIDFFQVQRIQ